MQTFVQLMQNEYIRLALAVGLICVAVIISGLLLRNLKLWNWKAETVLHALDTISYRLETVEDKLGIANDDVSVISKNVYAIGHICEENVILQEKAEAVTGEIAEEVKESRYVQEEMVKEIAKVRELLLVEPDSSMYVPAQDRYDYDEDDRIYDTDGYLVRDTYSTDARNEIDDFWLENEEQDFIEDDEDEIRQKIRL